MFSKLKSNLSPYGLLIAGLAVITLMTTLGGLWHYNQEVTGQTVKKASHATASIAGLSPVQSSASASTAPENNSSVNSSTTAKAGKSGGQSNGSVAAKSSATSPAAAAQSASVNVSLSVNGYPKGIINLPAGSTQCDLLAQALAKGAISSLDMRYSSQYKTQGVYVIDGIGDPGTVWWTYKVNGSAPPYGCGGMTAHDGDSVNWQYVKT